MGSFEGCSVLLVFYFLGFLDIVLLLFMCMHIKSSSTMYGLGVGFRPLTASNCLSRLNLQIVNISTCSASFRASLRNAAAQISPAAAKTYRSFVRSYETLQEGTDRLLQRCNIETTEPVPPDVHRSSAATDAWAFPDNVQTEHLNSTSLPQP